MPLAAPVQPVVAQKSATPAKRAGLKARAKPRLATPFGGVVQAKLALGPANDSYEREADRAAAHVLGGLPGVPGLSAVPGGTASFAGPAAGAPLAQRACAACAKAE